MSSQGVFAAVLLPLLWVLVTVAQAPKLNGTDDSSSSAGGLSNATESGGGGDGGGHNLKGFNVDSSMIQRALYVLIGITVIGVLYFLVRAVRLKKPTQKKKYGLLSNYDDNVEMDAMESDEDETVYEARSLKR